MTATIGSILQKERETRGLSLGQAAAATRIREDRLRELENDDFSNFPNPAYARMYFRLYCKYLDIQLTDEIDLLFPGALAGLDDYEYLRNEPVAPPSRAARPRPPKRSLAILAGSLLVVLIIVGALGLSLVWTAQRLGEWGAAAYTTMDERMREARNAPPKGADPLEAAEDPEAPVSVVEGNPTPSAELTPPLPEATLPTPAEMGVDANSLGALAEPALVNTDGEAAEGETAPGSTPEAAVLPPSDSLGAPLEPSVPQPALEGVAETSATPAPEGEAAPAPAEEEKPKPTPFAFPEPSPENSD